MARVRRRWSFVCIVAGTAVGAVARAHDRRSLLGAAARRHGLVAERANGELDAGGFGDTTELRELAAAVNAMRTNLRSSTISRDYLDRLLSSMGEALLITNADGKVERANAAAVELFGQDEAALIGKLADDLILSNDRRRAEGAASRPREGTVLRPDGTTVSVSYTVANVLHDGDAIQSKVYAAHNIDERKRVEQRIRYLARTDSLTKIANRMQFQHLLQQAIARARRSQQYVAIALSRRRPLQGHQRHVRPRRRRHEPRDLRAPRAGRARRERARRPSGRRRVRGADHGLRAARRDAAAA